ncbi:MAG: hypothetical protein ACUVXF_07030 [Desulfobaccales bacterium]
MDSGRPEGPSRDIFLQPQPHQVKDGAKIFSRIRLALAFLGVGIALGLPGGAGAEVEGYSRPTSKPQISVSAVPVFQFPARLGGGGRLSITGLALRA